MLCKVRCQKCLSICLSNTLRYGVQTAQHTVEILSSVIIPSSYFSQYLNRFEISDGLSRTGTGGYLTISDFRTTRRVSETVQDRDMVICRTTANRMWSSTVINVLNDLKVHFKTLSKNIAYFRILNPITTFTIMYYCIWFSTSFKVIFG